MASNIVAKHSVYNAAGAKIIQTQPYFLASGSSTATGSNDRGMTRTDYDPLGRPVKIYTVDPQGGQANITFGSFGTLKASSLQTIAYNGIDTLVTNDKGQTRNEERDLAGQTVRVTDYSGAQVAYQHDAFGNLIKTVDALQNQIVVTYDIRGRKTQLVDPDSGTSNYAYDALGQLRQQQNAKQIAAGTTTTLAYDVLGRLTSRVEPEYISTWSYDKNIDGSLCMQGSAANRGAGKLCESMTSNNGIDKKIVYDALGRPINSRTAITNGPVFASAVSYDGTTGRVASQTYPTGLQIGYGYTTGAVKGFLEKLTLITPATITPLPANPGGAAGASVSLATGSLLWQVQLVDAWGKAEKQTYGNSVVTQAQFEAATGRVSALTAGTSGSTSNAVLSQSYAWDSLSNLTGRADNNGAGDGKGVTETFNYEDALNRLTKYSVSAPAIANITRNVTLQYNALGMLLSKSDVGDYTYGSQGAAAVHPHALQSIAGSVNSNYTYDANGNVTGSSGGQYSAIAYTSFNLPDSQSGITGTANGGSRYTWLYDESHARLKEVRTVNSGTFAGTRTTWALHPDNQGGLGFESEVNAPSYANASNVAATSNRHYLSVGGQTIGLIMTSGALPSIGSATAPPTVSGITIVKLEYWHQDQLGSLISTTDHTGAVTQRYAYDPFGKRRLTNGVYDVSNTAVVDWSAGLNHGTERGFTGHQELDEVGLVHMNGRIFDPTLGLFLQSDPMIQDPGNLQNYNRYAYCYNNPLGCRDPSGLNFIASAMRLFDPVNYAFIRLNSHSDFGRFVQSVANGVGSAWCFAWAAACYGAATAVDASVNGYSNSQALRAGVIAGATSEAFYQAGNYSDSFQASDAINSAPTVSDGGFVDAYTNGSAYSQAYSSSAWSNGGLGRIALHAAVGCGTSILGAGDCKSGALSAGFAEAATPIAAKGGVAGVLVSAVVGGTAAELGGGKFANGAMTGAFGYLFNELLHQGSAREAQQRSGYVETSYSDGTYCNIQGGSGACGDPHSTYSGTPQEDSLAVCGGGAAGGAGGACVTSQREVVAYAGLATPGKSFQVVLTLNGPVMDYISGVSYNIQTPWFGLGVSPASGWIPYNIFTNTYALTWGTPGASVTYGIKSPIPGH